MTKAKLTRILSVPSPQVAGYEDALKAYFATYKENLATFFTVNFASIHAFEMGTEEHPAVFALSDVLIAYDTFFRSDGSVNINTFREFRKAVGVTDDNRYAWLATSSRLTEDALDCGLAASRSWGKRVVIPEAGRIRELLVTRIKNLVRTEDVQPYRILPAYHLEIEEALTEGMTQAQIAQKISRKTGRPVSQVDVSRFLKRVQEVRNRYAEKRFRAAATLEMAEAYAQERLRSRE